jgi:hypothetical protein
MFYEWLVKGQYRSYWQANQEEKKKKGRPRIRWTDDIKLGLMNVGVDMWRTKAMDGTDRVSVMRGDKAKHESL